MGFTLPENKPTSCIFIHVQVIHDRRRSDADHETAEAFDVNGLSRITDIADHAGALDDHFVRPL